MQTRNCTRKELGRVFAVCCVALQLTVPFGTDSSSLLEPERNGCDRGAFTTFGLSRHVRLRGRDWCRILTRWEWAHASKNQRIARVIKQIEKQRNGESEKNTHMWASFARDDAHESIRLSGWRASTIRAVSRWQGLCGRVRSRLVSESIFSWLLAFVLCVMRLICTPSSGRSEV